MVNLMGPLANMENSHKNGYVMYMRYVFNHQATVLYHLRESLLYTVSQKTGHAKLCLITVANVGQF